MIVTQSGSFTSRLFQVGSTVPEERRDALLEDINRIIDTNWLSEERFWSRQHSPFKADHGIVFLYRSSECVAYLIFQRLAVDSNPVIYISGTAAKDTYRDNGFFKRMLDTAMTAEFGHLQALAQLCFCWRTRNPVVYKLGRAICQVVVPSIADKTYKGDLDDLCLRMAATLYPDQTIERETMVMRGIYNQLQYRNAPKARASPDIDEWFSKNIPSNSDGVFCLGLTKNHWSQCQTAADDGDLP